MLVKELLSQPSHWIQGNYARNTRHMPCPYDSQDAVCWCLIGAIHACYSVHESYNIEQKIMCYLKLSVSYDNPSFNDAIIQWNDKKSRTFDEVAAVINALNI